MELARQAYWPRQQPKPQEMAVDRASDRECTGSTLAVNPRLIHLFPGGQVAHSRSGLSRVLKRSLLPYTEHGLIGLLIGGTVSRP